MYKLLDVSIPDIWYNPIFSDKYLIANTKDRTIQIFDLRDLSLIRTFGSNISYITIFGDYLFASDDEQTFIFKLSDLKSRVVTVPGMHILPAFIDDNFIYSNHQTSSSLKIGKYDYHTHETKMFDYTIGREVVCVNDHLIFAEKAFQAKRIFCLSSVSGDMVWIFDVDKLGDNLRLYTPMMAYQHIVAVPVSDDTLIGIDCKSGKLLWRRSGTNDLLRSYKSVIVNVDMAGYREISFENGRTLVEFGLTEAYKTRGFGIVGTNNRFLVTDDQVYFTDTFGGTLGSLNRKSGGIEWSIKVNKSKKIALTQAPLVNGNRLYQLDSEGTLHVLERNPLQHRVTSI